MSAVKLLLNFQRTNNFRFFDILELRIRRKFELRNDRESKNSSNLYRYPRTLHIIFIRYIH